MRPGVSAWRLRRISCSPNFIGALGLLLWQISPSVADFDNSPAIVGARATLAKLGPNMRLDSRSGRSCPENPVPLGLVPGQLLGHGHPFEIGKAGRVSRLGVFWFFRRA